MLLIEIIIELNSGYLPTRVKQGTVLLKSYCIIQLNCNNRHQQKAGKEENIIPSLAFQNIISDIFLLFVFKFKIIFFFFQSPLMSVRVAGAAAQD